MAAICIDKKAIVNLALFFAAVLAIGCYLAFVPLQHLENGRSICLFQNLLHLQCPGCGMTRAFACVLRGELRTAIAYNRLVVIVFPLMGWVVGRKFYSLVKGVLPHKMV